MTSIDDECKLQLLRVAELQADDYHKDRQLYLACRDDRETFCHDVKAGNGAVYKCLYKHKFDLKMSQVVSFFSCTFVPLSVCLLLSLYLSLCLSACLSTL